MGMRGARGQRKVMIDRDHAGLRVPSLHRNTHHKAKSTRRNRADERGAGPSTRRKPEGSARQRAAALSASGGARAGRVQETSMMRAGGATAGGRAGAEAGEEVVGGVP